MRPQDGDAAAVRRAAVTIGVRVTLVSAGLVVLVAAAAVTFIVHESRPQEQLEPPAPGETRIYVDAVPMLVGTVVIGLCAIVLAGAASWVIARSAVRPLGRALSLQRSFVADASHELRTPLSVLDARLQLLERRPPEGAAFREAIGRSRRDARALIDLVTDLLLLAEAGSPEQLPELGAPSTPLAPVVQDTAAAMALVAAEHGVAVDAQVDDLPVAMPETSLRRALTALLDNGIAHSPEGATVRVRAQATGRRVALTVEDEGAGIHGIDPERVFERFARSPVDERPRGGRGFGIGLALVRDVVVRWGGSVAVARTSAEGTALKLELPIADTRRG